MELQTAVELLLKLSAERRDSATARVDSYGSTNVDKTIEAVSALAVALAVRERRKIEAS